MKKNVVLVGILIILSGVWFSGCEYPPDDVSVEAVVNNYEHYFNLNREIQVCGWCMFNPPYGYISDDKGNQLNIEYSSALNGYYCLVGKIYTKTSQSGVKSYYLDVLKYS